MTDKKNRDFAALRRRFFESYIALEPEDASTLGLNVGDGRLKDLSPAGLDNERSLYDWADADLLRVQVDELTLADRLDHAALQRLVRVRQRRLAVLAPYAELERGPLPYHALAHQAGRAQTQEDWQAVADGARQVPDYLTAHTAALRDRLRAGPTPQRAVVEALVHWELLQAARFFELLPQRAQAARGDTERVALEAQNAYQRFSAFLRDDVLPHASEATSMGEEAYAWELEHVLGLREGPDDLIREAEATLEDLQAQLVRVCARHAGQNVRTFEQARDVVLGLQHDHLGTENDIRPSYARILARVVAFVRERRLFDVDTALEVPMLLLGDGMGEADGNWFAPLTDRRRTGYFVVSASPQAHTRFWSTVYAVHEAVPGHYLQSSEWQTRFNRNPAPVRFLGLTDRVASTRQDFGVHLTIEGWAVYTEELLRENGFLEGVDEIAVLVSHAIRAARVIVDVGLHTGRLTIEQAVGVMGEGTCMPERWARGQLGRYARIPTQAITYHVGRRAIERLKADARTLWGSGFTEIGFHQTLLSFGPLLPSLIAKHWPRLPAHGEGKPNSPDARRS